MSAMPDPSRPPAFPAPRRVGLAVATLATLAALAAAPTALAAAANQQGGQPAGLPGRPALQTPPASASREERLAQLYAREEALWQEAGTPGAESNQALQDGFLALTQAYEEHLRAEPNDVEARLLYGKLLRRLGQNNRAQEVFIDADRLNPRLGVVKQQIGNYLAERGDALGAVRMFLWAVDLEPEVALYHNQLGELLSHFRETLLRTGEFTTESLERQMLAAFGEAVRLAPEQVTFRLRWAEAHEETTPPDWAGALAIYTEATPHARSELERQSILLRRARCLLELDRPEEAKPLIDSVTDPRLAASLRRLQDFRK